MENFLSSITEDEKDDFKPPVEQNSSDDDRLLDLGLGLRKEKDDNKTDEENAEVETRAGSQKEQESLLQQFVKNSLRIEGLILNKRMGLVSLQSRLHQ